MKRLGSFLAAILLCGSALAQITTPSTGFHTINQQAGGGSGTVTSASVVTANGVSASVATPTTTPAFTFTLGAITPTTVNGITFTTGTGTLTLGSVTLNAGAGGTLGSAAFTAATAYEVPLTFSTGLTRTTNTITIGAGAITNSMLAGSIAFSKLVGSDITTVGTLSAGAIPTTLLTGALPAANEPAHTGDATNSAASLAMSVKQAHWNETAVAFGASPYTVAATDSVIAVDATGGAVVINLPAATGGGRQLTVKKTDSSANTVTVTRAGADLIDGAATAVSSVQYATMAFIDTASAAWSRTHVNQLGGDLSGVSTAAKVNALESATTSVNVSSATAPTNGQVLTATGGTAATWQTPAAAGANTTLSNLGTTSINSALLPSSAAGFDFGSATLPWKDAWIAGSSGTPGTNNFRLTGTATAARVVTFPDVASYTLAQITNAQTFAGTQTFAGVISTTSNGSNSAPVVTVGGTGTGLFTRNGSNAVSITGNTNGMVEFAASLGALFTTNTPVIGWTGAATVGSGARTGISEATTKVIAFGDGGANANGWYNFAGTSKVSGSDVTNATATLAAITGLSANVLAGRRYIGEINVKCINSTAAEGIQFAFDGGTATFTSFIGGASVFVSGGTDTAGTLISTANTTALNWTTLTGETWITIKFSMVINAAGTFIPRFAENTHSAGTATVRINSYMRLEDIP